MHEDKNVSFVLSVVAVILGLALIGLSAWQFAVSIGGGMSLRTADEQRNFWLTSVAALSGLFLLGVVIAKCIDKRKHAAKSSYSYAPLMPTSPGGIKTELFESSGARPLGEEESM